MNDVHSFNDVIMHYDSSWNSTKLKEFLNMLNLFIRNSPTFCPLVIRGDFNVDMLQINEPHQSHESKCLQNCMYQHDLHTKTNRATKCNTLLDHVWTNVLRNDSKAWTMDAYWPGYHQPIYFAFKLLNHIPMYIKNTLQL